MKLPFVQLKAKRNSVHPWIFHKMVGRPKKRIQSGEIVEVYSKENEFIGRGFYNRNSNINIRLLTEDQNEVTDETFFKNKIANAIRLRKEILKLELHTDSYRIINAEGDYLSGLIVDKFGKVIIVDPSSAGWIHLHNVIINCLKEHYPNHTIITRPDEKNSIRENVEFSKLQNKNDDLEIIQIKENDLSMYINLRTGHKTGFFLDQRDNRKFISSMCNDKDVLDLCCYTGGFSISAALNKAKSVTAIDLDEKAIEVAQENAKLNQVNVKFIHQDTYDHLRNAIENNMQFDVVILDPPKMGRNAEELGKAKKGYNDLNRMAMQCVRSGGVLLTCSCTGTLPEHEFLNILTRAANQANVQFQIFKISGPSDDHPFAHIFPEGRYLNAVYGRIKHVNRTYSPVSKNTNFEST